MCHRELSVAIQLRACFRNSAPKAGAYFITWFRLPGWPGGYFMCHKVGVAFLHVLGVMRPTLIPLPQHLFVYK
jgi:hypothetical protein